MNICSPDFRPEPTLIEILVDQLIYLHAHESAACAPDCRDCARLRLTKVQLLLPFRCVDRDVHHPTPKLRVKAA